MFHDATEGRFVDWSRLDDFAFPSGHRRLLDYMRRDVRFARFFSD